MKARFQNYQGNELHLALPPVKHGFKDSNTNVCHKHLCWILPRKERNYLKFEIGEAPNLFFTFPTGLLSNWRLLWNVMLICNYSKVCSMPYNMYKTTVNLLHSILPRSPGVVKCGSKLTRKVGNMLCVKSWLRLNLYGLFQFARKMYEKLITLYMLRQ